MKEREDNNICEYKVSVIIPVYNTSEKLFKRMIKSVMDQSFKEFEVLVIDDGSDETTAKMLDTFEKEYREIQVFHIENSGVSEARNYGVRHAKGEYITFVDADDYIKDTFLEEAYVLADKNDADIVYGTVMCLPGLSLSRQKKNETLDIVEKSNIDDIKMSLMNYSHGKYGYVIIGGPWGRLIRKDLLDIVSFNSSLKLSEDQIWNRELLNVADKVISCRNTWYYYELNEQSVTQKVKGDVLYFNKIKPYWDLLYKINMRESAELQMICDYHALCEYIQLICTGYLHATEKITVIKKEMKKAANHPLITKAVRDGISNKVVLDLKERIALLLIRFKLYGVLLSGYRIYFKLILKQH